MNFIVIMKNDTMVLEYALDDNKPEDVKKVPQKSLKKLIMLYYEETTKHL